MQGVDMATKDKDEEEDDLPKKGEEVADEEDDPESRQRRAQIKFLARAANRRRDELVTAWREVSKPNRQGAIPPHKAGARLDTPALFGAWLDARGLGCDSTLVRADNETDEHKTWYKYRYVRDPVVQAKDNWDTAFHGTWWYSLWSVLESGVFLESNDWGKGHDFWMPGVYCSPHVNTGRWYARPHILFGDDVFHRIVFELRVDPEKRMANRERGGVQWVFPSSAVALHGVWIQSNAPPKNGEERVYEWQPELEALPDNREAVPNTVNSRTDAWPEVDEEDPAFDISEAAYPTPPHLGSSNKKSTEDGKPAFKWRKENGKWVKETIPPPAVVADVQAEVAKTKGFGRLRVAGAPVPAVPVVAKPLLDGSRNVKSDSCKWCRLGECWTDHSGEKKKYSKREKWSGSEDNAAWKRSAPEDETEPVMKKSRPKTTEELAENKPRPQTGIVAKADEVMDKKIVDDVATLAVERPPPVKTGTVATLAVKKLTPAVKQLIPPRPKPAVKIVEDVDMDDIFASFAALC